MIPNITNVIIELEQESDHVYRKAILEFVLFTNDLDKSRNQSFKDVCPELYQFLVGDGNIWNDDLRHAVS